MIFEFFVFEKSKKPLFLAYFGGVYCALLCMERFFDLERRAIAQNDRNTILLKWVEKNFKISPPKNTKNQFFGSKNGKNDQKIEKISKFFF